MHFDDLRHFIAEAEKLGEVERINGADPHLEMGAIFAVNGQGPNPKLILFDEIKGYRKGYRVATNVLGSRIRTRLANNIPLDLDTRGLDELMTRRLYERKPVPPEYVD